MPGLADVETVLRVLEAVRSERGPGNGDRELEDQLTALITRITSRSQLDRLVAGLPGAAEVVERCHAVLLAPGPTEVDDEELIRQVQVIVAHMIAQARDLGPGYRSSDIELFERLGQLPVVVEPDPMRAGASELLSDVDIATIEDSVAEGRLLSRQVDPSWSVVLGAFSSPSFIDEAVSDWLLEPVTTGGPPARPRFELWRAGATIRVQRDCVAVLRSGARPLRNASYRASPDEQQTVEPRSGSEFARWCIEQPEFADRVVELIDEARGAGHSAPQVLDFGGLALPSMPPLDDGDRWEILVVSDNPGIDLANIVHFPRVTRLALDRNDFTDIPPSVSKLSGLRFLSLSKNLLQQIPDWFIDLRALEEFSVADNALGRFPSALVELHRLQDLDLAGNALDELPSDIERLTNLRALSLFDNKITELPTAIGGLGELQMLDLTQNPIAQLPSTILDLRDGCRVKLTSSRLPDDVQRARSIRALREVWPATWSID